MYYPILPRPLANLLIISTTPGNPPFRLESGNQTSSTALTPINFSCSWPNVSWTSATNLTLFPTIVLKSPTCCHTSTELHLIGLNPPLLLFYVGIQYGCLYQSGKEKNNFLCSVVPGGDTAVPCWEIWALACWISAESGGKMLWGWGWKGCRKWWKANMPVVSVGLWGIVIKGCMNIIRIYEQRIRELLEFYDF